jgi:hypothetical protein
LADGHVERQNGGLVVGQADGHLDPAHAKRVAGAIPPDPAIARLEFDQRKKSARAGVEAAKPSASTPIANANRFIVCSLFSEEVSG